ncbi:hypothetical protein J4411_01320 [Candidatus Pacearchaeota archaeon]|nr:hypothetical protein [uncultured archaeon]MBS3084534.1 hypothetical protein [Candidatus Pacearchaeota archaeon]
MKNFYISLRGEFSFVSKIFEKVNTEFSNYLKNKSNYEIYYVVPGSQRKCNLNFEKNYYNYFDFNKFKYFEDFGMYSHLKTTYESNGFNNKEIISRLEINLFGWNTSELNTFCGIIKKIDKSVNFRVLKPFL